MSYLDFDFPHAHMYNDDLKEILCIVTKLNKEYGILTEWKRTHEEEYEELKKIVDDIEKGILPKAVYNKLYKFMEDNMFDIIGSMVKFITVSINDNGYIVIRYPQQWSEIIFNTTGLDINTAVQPEYGHLTISY